MNDISILLFLKLMKNDNTVSNFSQGEESDNFDDNKASYTTTHHHITHLLLIFQNFSEGNLETNLNADVF